MKNERDKEIFICRRLRQMGFIRGQKLRLYGDEFELESNPVQQGSEYVIEGISHRSGSLRQVQIPITIVGLVENEFDVMEKIKLAA